MHLGIGGHRLGTLRTREEDSATSEQGYLHCAGPKWCSAHFTKWCTTGIEYGVMAALKCRRGMGGPQGRHNNRPRSPARSDGGKPTVPLRDPEHYQYESRSRGHFRGCGRRGKRDRLVAASISSFGSLDPGSHPCRKIRQRAGFGPHSPAKARWTINGRHR